MTTENIKERIIEIEPITRVEGHGKITIHLDQDNKVKQARLHIVEFRGFERFIQGRLLWEVPVIVQRLCGICPVSHHLAASKAMDIIVGANKVTPTADKMRRLMHYGQIMQSHALHFFHLASPDILFGFGADLHQRNVFEVIKQNPDLALKGVKIRKFGQEVIKYTAGKKIHGTGSIPGGVNKNLSINERDLLLKDLNDIYKWTQESLNLVKNYILDNLELTKNFANFDSSHLSLVQPDGALELYDGCLRCVDANENIIFDQVDNQKFNDYLIESVQSWTYMKFPYIKTIGENLGWYRVGPLSRLNTCSYIDTPLANQAYLDFKKVTNNSLNHASLVYHWARMIEIIHCLEKIDQLLHDSDLQGTDLVTKGQRQQVGIGIIEAPRGTLCHHFEVDENDQVTFCNLIVSTTHNNEAMNRAVTDVAVKYLDKQPNITEAMLNHLEVAVRAYDPCLSCATHALGQMPLMVELYDCEGKLVDNKSQYVKKQ